MASSLITIDTRSSTSGFPEPSPRRDSAASMRTDTTWRYSVFGPERMGKGAVLFTGPDGIRDHRVYVEAEHRYVGDGTMSPEGSSEVEYLWRMPSNASTYPRPKSVCVGEIGWGIPSLTHWSQPRRRPHIELGEFRQAVEDRHTHLYQNAWYPGPNERFPENSDAGLVMNVYETRRQDPQQNYRTQESTGQTKDRRSITTHSIGAETTDTRDTGYVSQERHGSQVSSHRESQASMASRHSSAHSAHSSYSAHSGYSSQGGNKQTPGN